MSIEVVWVGLNSELRRYMVVDANGKFVPGGLFKTRAEAAAFIAGKQS